jgi:hypothetical protein
MSNNSDISRSDIQQLIGQHDADEPFPEDLRIMADDAGIDISDDALCPTPSTADDTVSLTVDVIEPGSHKNARCRSIDCSSATAAGTAF